MQYKIGKRFQFAASHQLDGLPAEHKCSRLHGHNYIVEVVVAGPLDDNGFVMDFGEVSQTVGQFIQDRFDHRHLNDEMPDPGDGNPLAPTAENIAAYLLATFPFVSRIRVEETPTCWAEVER